MFQLPFPVRDANAGSGSDNLGDLPEWNLDDLYAGEEAPELSRDLDWLEGECAKFAADYEGKLGDLDADGLLKCVLRNEYASGAMGELAPIDVWPEIWVLRDRDYDRAKLVIEQLHADLQEADWECGQCGRFSPASFDWCWHCAGERPA